MKKVKSNFLYAVILLLLFSCGKTDTPRSVAEKFLKEMSVQDFDEAKQYGTAETENLMNMMSGFKKISNDSTFVEVQYEIVREAVTGDNAIIYYQEVGKAGELQLPMVKENGKWLVSLNKESINNSDPAMDLGATTLDTIAK